MNDNPFTIPAEILEAATKIGVWAKKNNFMDWFAKRHQKVYKSKKAFAEREAGWFVLYYGWRVELDPEKAVEAKFCFEICLYLG